MAISINQAASLLVAACVTGSALAQLAPETEYVQDDVLQLWSYASETGPEEFGFTAERIGDVTGDGVDDLAVGSPRWTGHRGRVTLLDARTGALVRTHDGTRSNEAIGFRQGGLGDLNGDGVREYYYTAVGVPGNYQDQFLGSEYRGVVFIHSGADGALLRKLVGAASGDRFGYDIGAVGDVTGDGTPDFVVGSPGGDDPAAPLIPNVGRVDLFSGADFAIVWTAYGDTDMGRLGKGMSGIADLDGDGLDDVLAAAPGEGATRAGRVHIRSGTDGALIDLVDPDDLGDFPNAQEFGRFFLFDAGDLNLDGVHDLYICDMFDDEHGFTSGRLYVVSGADRSLLFEREGDIDNGWFSVGRPIGDQNNDGRPDLLVSTLGSSDGGFRTGRVQIYSGADGSLVREITSQRLSPPPFSLGYGECFGWDAINAGDVNGDGVDDIFATAPYWNSQGPELGHGYLILGKPRCPADVTSIGTSDGVPDGAVDLSDIALYLSLWTTGGARADVTGDGACDPAGAGDGVTLSDFACYLSQWSIGCPPAT